jgi:hypothetical protein
MSIAKIQPSQEQLLLSLETLKEDVSLLKSQIADLEQQNAKSSRLLEILGKRLGFGPNRKLEWVRFKLKIKAEELSLINASYQSHVK